MPDDFIPSFSDAVSSPAQAAEVQQGIPNTNWNAFSGAFQASSRYTSDFSSMLAEYDSNTRQLGGMITPEQANKEFPSSTDKPLFQESVPWNYQPPISRTAAAIIQRRSEEGLQLQDINSNSKSLVPVLAGGFAGTMLDPIALATNFTPVGWEVDVAKLGTLAHIGVRAAQGAQGGVVSMGALSVMDWQMANEEQRDYGLNDFMQSVSYGGVMGAFLHVGSGALGDSIRARTLGKQIRDILPADAQTEALQLANQGVYDFNDIMGVQPKVVAEELSQDRTLTQDERLDVLASNEAPAKHVFDWDFGTGAKPIPMYNLTEDIAGHTEGSTVSDKTLTDLGYSLPEKDKVIPDKDAIALERKNRLNDLLKIEPDPIPVKNTEVPDAKLSLTNDIAKSATVDDANVSLEAEVKELEAQIKETEPKEPVEGEKPIQSERPPVPDELKEFSDSTKNELQKSVDFNDSLKDRETGIRTVAQCVLNALT